MENLSLFKYYGDDLTKPKYILSEIILDGYKDITSVKNIINYSKKINLDFIFIIDFLMSFISRVGIINLNISDISLLCQYALVPYDNDVYLYTEDKYNASKLDVNNELLSSLIYRKEKSIDAITNELTTDTKNKLHLDLNIDNTTTFDLDDVLLKVSNINYLSEEQIKIITNIMNGEYNKAQINNIY
tara:strand:+ start:575 stop:1135 length:561 start_codon:yes stop_codon:yes gene_type:complete